MLSRGGRDLIADGVCGQGHLIAGRNDVLRRAGDSMECRRCHDEMLAERAALRRAAVEREQEQQRRDVMRWARDRQAARAERAGR